MAAPRAYLAMAAIGLFVGCQGSLTPGGSPDAGSGGGDAIVTGRWAMFVFEDPVAVDLRSAGGVIAGNGCCAGLGNQPGLQCCGAVNGQLVHRHATFGFSFDNFGQPYEYATDAFVSADGRRMVGTFTRSGRPVTWARIGSSDRWLPEPDPALQEILLSRTGSHRLLLTNDTIEEDFVTQRFYQLDIFDRFVYGDLGAFWSAEMSWNAAEQTLVVGPVPETAPGFPVALWLRFDRTVLVSVEAAMVGGTRYYFQPFVQP